MPMTACVWCNDIIEVKRLPRADEVSVCRGTNCGDMEMHFRAQFSDHNIGLFYAEETGVNPNERGKRCGALKRKSTRRGT